MKIFYYCFLVLILSILVSAKNNPNSLLNVGKVVALKQKLVESAKEKKYAETKLLGRKKQDVDGSKTSSRWVCSETCFPPSKYEWLKSICYNGVKDCYLHSYPYYGYSCICNPSPSPRPPTPTPTSSPKPKCYGEIYYKCFPTFKKYWLEGVCPYGLEDCTIYYGHYSRPGYKCKCIVPPTPTSTPTRTPTPTPSSSPKPKCYGESYSKCSLYRPHCLYGYDTCYIYYGHYRKSGYKCKCPPPSPPPSYPSVSKCPFEVNTYSTSRSFEYKIDLGKTSGCFNVYYYFDYTPFTIYVYYDGKTLIKDRVNYQPGLPVKLCYNGYSSVVTVKINTTLGKKIQFKVECPLY